VGAGGALGRHQLVRRAGPEPGSDSNILGGIANVAGQLWAAGVFDNGDSELPFIEHR